MSIEDYTNYTARKEFKTTPFDPPKKPLQPTKQETAAVRKAMDLNRQGYHVDESGRISTDDRQVG